MTRPLCQFDETERGTCRCVVCGVELSRAKGGCGRVYHYCSEADQTPKVRAKRKAKSASPDSLATRKAKLPTSPGWQLHQLLRRWLGQEAVAGCGCNSVMAWMDRVGSVDCRKHLEKLVDRLVNVATAKQWVLAAEPGVDPTDVGNPVPQTRRTRLARLVARATAVLPGGEGLVRAQCRAMILLAIRRAERAVSTLSSTSTKNATPQSTAFVYPYLAREAMGDELLYSVRSVEKNYQGQADIWIVGDRPAWWRRDDRFIHCPKIRGGARIDRANKLDAICREERIPESFIWMQDDIYLVRPADLAFLSTLWTRQPSPLTPKELDAWKPHSAFDKQKRVTYQALLARGKPLHDYAAHTPVLYSKVNVRKMIVDYDMLRVQHVDDLVYGNESADPSRSPQFIDNLMCRILKPVNERTLRQRLASAQLFNHDNSAYKGAVKKYLEDAFPERTKWEVNPYATLGVPLQSTQGVATVPRKMRGIVTLAGGPLYFINAYVNCRLLRLHGCTLPIEWFCLGAELPEEWRRTVLRDVPNLRFIDFGGASTNNHKGRGGWQAKIEAILASSFLEILFVDADSFARRDPTAMFDSPVFREHPCILWPDIRRFKRPARRFLEREFGVPLPERQVESGQMMFRKPDCIRGLLRTQAINRNSERVYKILHGDKDTFLIGAIQGGVNYTVVPYTAERVKGGLVQKDFDGNAMFTHLTNSKWTPSEPSLIQEVHFPRLHEAYEFYREACEVVSQPCEQVRSLNMQTSDPHSHNEAVQILCNDMYEIKPMVGHRIPVKYIVDIGGNVGAFALHAALTYPDAEILLVEPDPKIMEMARANTRGCSAKIHYIEKACVGLDSPKTVLFCRIIGASGGSHVVPEHWNLDAVLQKYETEELQVPTATLPELLEEVGFSSIDILKIDCEGLEGEILTSLQKTEWLSKTHWIRGEWHGRHDIPVIQAALAATHVCICPGDGNNGPMIAHNVKDA